MPPKDADKRRKYIREYQRERRANDPSIIRADNLWRHYRIRLPEYDALRSAQDFRCVICRRHEDEIDASRAGGRPRKDGSPAAPAVKLVVDHDHETGAVRGLLCGGCNRGIGMMREDATALRRAAEYVEHHLGIREAA